MKRIAELLNETIRENESVLRKISSEASGLKPINGGWSKKEILGHLIDSACNNHQRFVRAAYNEAKNFPPYDQNKWVNIQGYNEREWSELIDLFLSMNNHLARLISKLPEDTGNNLCNIGKEEPVTLKFISQDYIRHLRHHLEVILK